MEEKQKDYLKSLPSVDRLLKKWQLRFPDDENEKLVKKAANLCLEVERKRIFNEECYVALSTEGWFERIEQKIAELNQLSLRKVINGTGTLLHTNLGRAVLSESIKKNVESVAFGYSNLEYDLSAGKRGSRYVHLEELIQELTGAESVLVVNNNAAAVLLALSTLVSGKEVVVSRGELVEIGGSFRIPDVIKSGGGQIVEVGTTNKTRLQDYQEAITDETAALMKIHTSNYRVIGFTGEVSCKDLANLAHSKNLPLINDAGSGLFLDLSIYGLPYEPTIKELVQQGCDVVTFSGDKLLGGPQAGIIVGKKEFIEPMKKNQLLRALRIDKLTMAALEATLQIYLDEKKCVEKIPLLRMLSLTMEECYQKAEELCSLLMQRNSDLVVEVIVGESEVGGGAYPGCYLPTYLVKITSIKCPASELELIFRNAEIPIIGRVKNNSFLLDVRTIDADDFKLVKKMIRQSKFTR